MQIDDLGEGCDNIQAAEDRSSKNTLQRDTFITGVPVAPSPLPQKVCLVIRVTTQKRM